MPVTPAATRIVAIDPEVDPRWDAFVLGAPDPSPYHLAAWAPILRRAYGYRPRALAALDGGGAIVGVLPLFGRRGLLGARLTSMPVAWSAGPLGATPQIEAELLRAAVARAGSLGAGKVLVRSRREGLEALAPELQAAPYPPAWELALPADEAGLEALWRSSKRLWRSLRKAEAGPIAVREARGDAELRAFHALYLATMRRLRVLPKSLRLLRLARERLGPDRFRLLVVEHEGAIVAGAVFYDVGDRRELIYNASDPAHLDLRPNHALYAHAIRDALGRGLRRFDFGGAGDGTDLAAFKQQWGAERAAVVLYGWRADGGAVAGGGDDAAPGGERLDALWERAPLRAYEAAATAAYRLA